MSMFRLNPTQIISFPAVQVSSLLHSVQTGSGTHPGSYPIGIGIPSPEDKAAGGVKLTTHLHLVPRSRKMELYLHSLIELHGIVLN
jgi:hypothetical protein